LPTAPLPADGGCDQLAYASPVPPSTYATQYYYYASGTAFVGNNNITVNPDYGYYFCLGNQTGNLAPGLHISSPTGLR